MNRAILGCFIALLAVSSGVAASLRENYETCVANNYLQLLIDGRPKANLTAEQAVRGCETELQALHSLLINTNMDPKQALSMISNIRISAKLRLLK